MGSDIVSAGHNNDTEREFPIAGDVDLSGIAGGIVDRNERVLGGFVGSDGIVYEEADTRRRVSEPILLVATGDRVVFATDRRRDADVGSLAYAELASVCVEGGAVVLVALDGTRCTVPLPAETPGVDAVVNHLRWVGNLRSDLVACRNDVGLVVGEIRDRASAMEWEAAEREYTRIRRRLDRLVVRLLVTGPVRDDALAPELDQLERRLELACARLFVERAASRLELAEQLVGAGEFDRVGSVLGDARQYYREATSHAAAIERGDGFRFGEQRELREALDGVDERIESVLAEPLDRAAEQRRLAAEAETRADGVAHLETALERYRDVVTNRAGERPGDARAELAAVARELVEEHRALARAGPASGGDHGSGTEDGGERATRRLTERSEHLERAAELAVEFDCDTADDLAVQARDSERILATMRTRVHPTRPSTESGESGSEDRSGSPDGSEPPSTRELAVGTPAEEGATGVGTDHAGGAGTEENLEELTEEILQSDPGPE